MMRENVNHPKDENKQKWKISFMELKKADPVPEWHNGYDAV